MAKLFEINHAAWTYFRHIPRIFLDMLLICGEIVSCWQMFPPAADWRVQPGNLWVSLGKLQGILSASAYAYLTTTSHHAQWH